MSQNKKSDEVLSTENNINKNLHALLDVYYVRSGDASKFIELTARHTQLQTADSSTKLANYKSIVSDLRAAIDAYSRQGQFVQCLDMQMKLNLIDFLLDSYQAEVNAEQHQYDGMASLFSDAQPDLAASTSLEDFSDENFQDVNESTLSDDEFWSPKSPSHLRSGSMFSMSPKQPTVPPNSPMLEGDERSPSVTRKL